MATIKHRAFSIVLNRANEDRVEYRIERNDKSLIEHEDATGFGVTNDEVIEMAKEVIDDFLDNQ